MRVLQVMEATLGGTRRYLADLAAAAEREGYENAIAYSLVRADAAFIDLLGDLRSRGWKTFEIDMRREVGLHDVRSTIDLRQVYRRFVPDIVHAHSSKAGSLARLAAIGYRPRPTLLYTPNAIAVNLSKGYEIAERILAPLLDALVAVSPSERSELGLLRLKPISEISIIVPTVDGDYFAPRSRESARRMLGYEDGPIVSAVGRITAQKDPLGFVQFLTELRKREPEIRALWVGDGDLRLSFEDALEKAGLREIVTITGWVKDVRPYFAATNLFVSVAAYESFGYVTAEALASERAVIASKITGTVDIVCVDRDYQLYDPGDFPQAASLAHALLNNSKLSSEIAIRGRDFILSTFSKERTQKQLASTYTSALQARASRSTTF